MSQIARTNRFFNRSGATTIEAVVETIQIKVRRCIRAAGGLVGLNPDEIDMPDDADLKVNYKFSSRNFDSLLTRMNILLRNENAIKRVLFSEVNSCNSVGDCVKLVQSKQ
jgi:hypothetical protein